jgi:hypothetical protein
MIEQVRQLFRRLFPRAGGIRYKIGGREYIQRPLVLLQVEQLAVFIAGMSIPAGTTVPGLVSMLGSRISEGLAIILTPEGVGIDEKDLAEIAGHLRRHVDIDTAVKAVEDFLSCNPVGSVFDKLTGVMGGAGALATAMKGGSPSSSASSPEGT